MNLTHVLSSGSCFSSSALRRAYEHGRGTEVLAPNRHSGFQILSRSSDGEPRRDYGEGRKSVNGVSDRPRYQREQNDVYRSSGESRGNYRGGSKDTGSKSNSRNYRGGGYGKYERGHGRNRKKQMHPGAYSLVDEQTGEKVIVWGVETDDDIPVPTAEDLQWKKTILALPGDASDDVWAKVMEDSGYNDSYSVKGVEQGGRDWVDELYEEELDDDDEDEDNDDVFDDHDSESDFGIEKVDKVESRKVSRPARLKVFGRDVRGKSLLKVQTLSKDKEGNPSSPPSEGTKAGEDAGTVVQARNKGLNLVVSSNSEDDHVFEFPYEDLEDVERESRNDQVSPELPPTLSEESRESTVREVPREERVIGDEDPLTKAETVDRHFEEPHIISKASANNRKNSRSTQASTEKEEALPTFSGKSREGSSRILGTQFSPPDSHESNASSEVSSTFSEANVERWTKAPVNEKVPAPGEYYIIDVTDKDEGRSRRKQYDEVKEERKGNLLDQLRLQQSGKVPISKDSSASRGRSLDHEESPLVPRSTPSPISPMRDLTARDNYDSSIADDFFSQKSFQEVGATDEVVRALAYLQVDKPSQIQALSFTPIVHGRSCIIAEQTGSGKTLAYVAPLVQRLRADEAVGMGKALPKKPRVLVLVPTSELAVQVLKTFRALSKGGMPTRSIILTGGFKWKTQVENLEEGAEVVIATPGRLLQHLDAGTIQFDHVKSVVFDEVDILFDDEEFSKALQTINKTASIKVQYVHVTATLPVDVHDDLLERYPDCLSLMGPSLHKTAPGLQEILVDCSGGETDEKTPESAFANKRTALLQLVNEKAVSKTIVFCNKIETCRKVENILTRFDRTGKKIQVLPYHAALSQEGRLENLETFMAPQPKQRLFLVCTDRASRGIDSLDVEHVVLFDFPRDPSEYVRRIGRTARGAGGTGKVFVFVVGRQVSAARRIMDRNDKGYPIHDVPGDRYYYSN